MRIRQEHAMQAPLVGPRESLQSLAAEYQRGSGVFRTKIERLKETYEGMRRARGDGNCFFRAFAFAWYEQALANPALRDTFLATVFNPIETLFKQADYDMIAIGDFVEVARDTLTTLASHHELEATFNDAMTSNSIVTFFRFYCAAQLRTQSDTYAPFVEDCDIQRYCREHVEAFGQESDEVECEALAKNDTGGSTRGVLGRQRG